MFSFTRLRESDPGLGVEMASTGEVAYFRSTKEEAFLKSLISTGFQMPKKNILFFVQASLTDDATHGPYQLHELGYKIYATRKTADALQKNHVPCEVVAYPTEKDTTAKANAVDLIESKDICLVVIIPSRESTRLDDDFLLRGTAVDF
jgi:hypothetical protein